MRLIYVIHNDFDEIQNWCVNNLVHKYDWSLNQEDSRNLIIYDEHDHAAFNMIWSENVIYDIDLYDYIHKALQSQNNAEQTSPK